MNRSNLTITFYLKRSSPDALNASIYARITIDGIRKAFTTNRQIAISDWDADKQRAKIKSSGAIVVNNQMDSVRQLLFENHRVLSDQGLYVTTQMLYDKINEKEEEKLTFIDFYKQFLENKKLLVGTEITQDIINKYQRIYQKFLAFLDKKKLNNVGFADLDNDLGKDFFLYLKTVCGLSHNTAVKQMQMFKCVIKDAVRKGHLSNDPFYEVKFVVKEKARDYLIEEEIEAIAALSNLLPKIELVRDIFLFSCYTGLAYIDVKQLTEQNIRPGLNNKLWLFTQRQKTEVQSNIPLLPQAQQILDKYKATLSLRSGRLLPVLTNQKMNAYLKEIADLCHIKKVLTFHIARHTFATTVTLANGVSLETVSKMLGHKLIRTTQHYAKIVDIRVSSEMEALEKKLLDRKQ